MPKGSDALVLITDGVEEMEYIVIVDVLLRCGVRVVTACVGGHNDVKGAHDIPLRSEQDIFDVKGEKFNAIILPGGKGAAKEFSKSRSVGRLLKEHYREEALVCAICASPLALKAHKIGPGRLLTSYPSFKEELKDYYDYQEKGVVVDGNLVTSQGPGTAVAFALKIGEMLVGESRVKKVRKALLTS